MQISVPYSAVKAITYRESRTMASKRCFKCKQLCEKPLQLPGCEHVFCKRCMGDYFSTFCSWTDEPDYFSCPECGEKVSKPDLPVDKWITAINVYKTSTFFIKETDEVPGHKEVETGNKFEKSNNSSLKRTNASKKVSGSTFYTNDSSDKMATETGSDFVKVRKSATSYKSRSQHRAGMRLSEHIFEKGFESKISSDEKDCLYFGGDIMTNGDIILCDWLNYSVKMFEPSGQFICKIKLDEAPLDVTAVRNDMIVVSFGSRSKTVMFLAYVASSKVLDKLGCNKLPGYLYSTTMYEGTCLGVFERDGSKQVSVVQVTIDRTGRKSGAFRKTVTDFITSDKNVDLSSESGIFYDHKHRRLYVTSRRKLLCFREGKRLIFKESFERSHSFLYILGSVTCDKKGVVYVASDQCILRIAKEGGLISVINTPADPYHILVRNDQRKLAVVGKQSEVMYYSIDKGK